MYVLYSTLLHLPPPDSTESESEDAGIEPRTVASSAVRHSSHSATSHPLSATSHPHGYISSTLGYISSTLGYISSTLGYISPTLGYISSTLGYITSKSYGLYKNNLNTVKRLTLPRLFLCR